MTLDLTTETGRIRVMLGDTDESDLILSDAMIATYATGGALAQPSEYLAAAECAGAIAAKFARRAESLTAGGMTVKLGDQAKRYRELAESLRAADAAAETASGEGLFDIAEFVTDDFSARERLRNQLLREAV